MTVREHETSRRTLLRACGIIVAAHGLPDRASAQAASTDRAEHDNFLQWVSAIGFSGDGQLIAAANAAGAIGIWDIAGGQPLRTLAYPASQNSVGALAFSDDGKLLLVGNAPRRRRSRGKAIIAFDIESGDEAGSATADPDWVARFAQSPRSPVIATIGHGYDRSVRFWEKDGLRLLRLFPAHDSTVMALAMSADGNRIATGGSLSQRGGRDPSIKIWDVASGRELHSLSGHATTILDLAFTTDGRHLVSLASDAVTVWSIGSGTAVRSTPIGGGGSSEFALSPDGIWFAQTIDGRDGQSAALSLRAVATGEAMVEWRDPVPRAQSMAASPDGRLFATGDSSGMLTLWDAKTGLQRHRWTLPASPARAAAPPR